ncbi:YcxB family protein [bacterium]|nr:YcxB family protein [bacterium]
MRYTAEMQHTEESIRRLSKIQYHTFRPGVRLLWMAAGVGTIFGAVYSGADQLLFYLLMLAGCWLVMNLDLPAKHRADKIIASGEGKLPHTRFLFRESDFTAKSTGYEKTLNYRQLYALLEDGEYLYLFLNRDAGYMVDKATVPAGELEDLKAALQTGSGLTFRSPTTLLNLNLSRFLKPRRK